MMSAPSPQSAIQRSVSCGQEGNLVDHDQRHAGARCVVVDEGPDSLPGPHGDHGTWLVTYLSYPNQSRRLGGVSTSARSTCTKMVLRSKRQLKRYCASAR